MKKLYFLILSILLIGCANTEQSVIKNDDELTSKIKVLFDKYVAVSYTHLTLPTNREV